PTALGTLLYHRDQGVFGFGEVTIPPECWAKPGYKQASDKCLSDAQIICGQQKSECEQAGGLICPDEGKCVTSTMDACHSALPGQYGCAWGAKPPPVVVGGACNSGAVIMAVQGKIGTAVDGKWGPNSQAALTKSGQSFQALAPGCTGAAPSAGGGGYVPPPQPYVPPVQGQPPVVQPPPAGASGGTMAFFTGKFWGLPMYGWVGAGVAAIVLGLMMTRKDHPAYGSEY
ncbi:MAG: hypothetical protein V2A79_18210, partial [Planctomycetota bacterium]